MLKTEKKSNNLIIRYVSVLLVSLLILGCIIAFYGWYKASQKLEDLEGELAVQVENYKDISAKLTESTVENTEILAERDKLFETNEKLVAENRKLSQQLVEKYSTAVSTISAAKAKLEEAEKKKQTALKLQTGLTQNVDKSSLKNNYNSVISAGKFRASAYGADCGGCSGLTASGVRPVSGVTVAADPRVLPLGTVVYIEFPNAPAYNGTYTVQDTGGAIKGNKLDIFLGTEANSRKFGIQTAIVKIISKKK